jgi:hypothetical protein
VHVRLFCLGLRGLGVVARYLKAAAKVFQWVIGAKLITAYFMQWGDSARSAEEVLRCFARRSKVLGSNICFRLNE